MKAPETVEPAAVPEPGDEEEGFVALAFRRLRGRPVALAGVALVGAAGALHLAARHLGDPDLETVAAGVALAGAVAAYVGARRIGTRWRHRIPPEDGPDPIAARWLSPPARAGARGAQVHVHDTVLRVVNYRADLWDVLVLSTTILLLLWAGARAVVIFAIVGVLQAVGLPRPRRVATEMPWDEIERVEIRGPLFEVRSRLAPPADLFVLEAKYSAREKLTGALVQRLGARVTLVAPRASSAGRRSKSEPPRTAADLERAADRVRSLRDRSD